MDPSRAREPGGYGLGLAIAKAIVDRHKGRISVHSVPGKTTTFTVELPLSPAGRDRPERAVLADDRTDQT